MGGGGDKVAITRTTSLGKVNRIQRAEEGTPTSNVRGRVCGVWAWSVCVES